MPVGKKHGSCLAHPKLPCGCKVCETPTSTAHIDPDELVAFHTEIHSIRAQRAARPRLAGDGRIEGPNGERLTPAEVAAGHEKERDEYREGRRGVPSVYGLGALIELDATRYAPASRMPSRFAYAEAA